MKTTEVIIKGITWGHSRGYTPLVAAAQRFWELHPGITIVWEKRTLQQFADYPIEALARVYDLLIIDHPWVGTAAETGAVLPLDQHLPADYLKDQADNSVGYSHQSYFYGGHQWALAIDAATPVASYRPDLLGNAPDTWDEVLAIARKGRLAVPAIAIDLLMNFYTFCIAHGARPFQSEDRVIDPATGEAALDTMRELYGAIDKKFFHANPIAVAEYMTATDDYWYCPFAYGYSNYARDGYARKRLAYADLVRFDHRPPATDLHASGIADHRPPATDPSASAVAIPASAVAPNASSADLRPRNNRLRTTIGGTGLAIAANTKYPAECLDFAQYVCSAKTQSTFYMEHGGQPGHRQAWLNDKANRLTHNYFYTVLPAMDRGYMRPRYHGYGYFQDHAGDAIREFLLGQRDTKSTLNTLENLYAQSLKKHAENA
jgi:multiple sugar transport system substrate-binding protein